MIQTIPASEARKEFFELLENVGNLHQRVTITRDGRPQAILISAEEFEEWMETLEILSSQNTVRGIAEGLKELGRGKTRTHQEVFGRTLRARS